MMKVHMLLLAGAADLLQLALIQLQHGGDDFKAQITVCPDNENPAKTLSKNTYISEAMLNYLVPGRYIEIIYLPDDEENFLLATPQEVYIPRE